MSSAPRITTRFSPDMHAEILAWGRARGIEEMGPALRALVADALEASRGGAGPARAWRAAYEQALGELRQLTREKMLEVAAALPRPSRR